MSTKKKFLTALICFGAFLLLMLLLSFVDVASVGPCETSVGFSSLNAAFAKALGYHEWLYVITDLLGYILLLLVAVFAALGAWQWYKRKNILKVDGEILLLGGLYLVTLALYVIFNKITVNARPVLMAGELAPEPSFPSSHTVLSVVVLGSAMLLFKKYVKSPKQRKIMNAIGAVLMAVVILGRLLSGAHWLTDILGGILLSAAELAAFAGAVDLLPRRK